MKKIVIFIPVFVLVFLICLVCSAVESCRALNSLSAEKAPEPSLAEKKNEKGGCLTVPFLSSVPTRTTRVIKTPEGKIVLVGREEGSQIVWRDLKGKIKYTEKK